jgi:tRNA pseudouridine32 synthase/23S rRNA pseudouridine746 synthase
MFSSTWLNSISKKSAYRAILSSKQMIFISLYHYFVRIKIPDYNIQMVGIPEIRISDHILWMDEAILLVNKPSGMLTIRDGYNPDLPYLGQILAKEFGQVWVVHRLDRETSGIMVFARTSQAHQNLNFQFEHREIKKTYHTIAFGVPDRGQFSIDVSLRVNGDRQHRTIVDPRKGKNAITDFAVLEKYNGFCLIEARPATGYTHQIRAHLLAAGYPILLDPLYKLKSENNVNYSFSKINNPYHALINRLALHALSITFTHPLTGQFLEMQAPYPEDFKNALKRLREMN